MANIYSDYPTQETLRFVEHRDRYRCVRCGKPLENQPASHHHRKLRSQSAGASDKHAAYNLICLCGSGTTGCHGWVHAHPAKAYEMGLMVHAWQDPRDVPVHTWRGIRYLDQPHHEPTLGEMIKNVQKN